MAATFTYGHELEPAILANQITLLDYTGPSAGAFADVVLNRHFGLRPVVGVQYLAGAPGSLWIESLELGVYGRW